MRNSPPPDKAAREFFEDGFRIAWGAGFTIQEIAEKFEAKADWVYDVVHDPAGYPDHDAEIHIPVNVLRPADKARCDGNHPEIEGRNVYLTRCDHYGLSRHARLGDRSGTDRREPERANANGDRTVWDTTKDKVA